MTKARKKTVTLAVLALVSVVAAAWITPKLRDAVSLRSESNAASPASASNETNHLPPIKKPDEVQASGTTTVTTSRVTSSPRRTWGQVSEEQKRWTAEARPTEKTTLRLLDLTKVPTEKDLRMAGQLGEELQPTRAADPAAIADPVARKKQEADNLDFGKAIQKWNLHEYDEAQLLFLDHLTKFPDSPWAAESELHLGCACQYLGKLDEAQKWFEASQTRSPLGDPMHQKALLRLGVVAMDRGELQKATALFAQLRENESNSSRMTYASYWIRALSQMKAKETALRDCGQKSLSEVCALLGMAEQSKALRVRESAGPHGFTIQELENVAGEYGLTPQTVRASGSTLEKLPMPFVAHYKDNHFVAVLGTDETAKLRVYDTRVGHPVAMEVRSFLRQWSGLATLFSPGEIEGVRIASVQETIEAMGGCCGLPRNPDDLDDDCGGKCHGMPGWSINPVNMNLVVRDTPMWWDAPYGPDVDVTITYNSQDSLIAVRPFGDKWVLRYASYLVVDPSGSVKLIRGGGRGENFVPDGSGGYTPDARNATKTLRKITGFGYRFELEEADGSKWLYDVPPAMGGVSASSLLLSITDKYGTALTITHNSQGAITAVSHPAAVTTLSPSGTWTFVYDINGKVESIDDPFGRQATFAYDGNGRLTGQTDMGGLAYGYSYTTAAQVKEPDPDNPGQFVIRTDELFLNAIIAPSGTTQFYTEPADGINNMSQGYADYTYPPSGGVTWENYRITVTDALGKKEEHYYDGYHSLFWFRDKNHYKEGEPGTIKTVSYFTNVNGRGEVSSIHRQGGGSQSFSGYNDGGSPTSVTSEDGITRTYTYSENGKRLTETNNNGSYSLDDDVTFSYTYAANGIDVANVTRQIGTDSPVNLIDVEYDPVTREITAVEDQAGLRTEYASNNKGQLVSVTNPKGDVTSYTYNVKGWLEEVELQAAGQPTAITLYSAVPDDVGRNVMETNAEGLVLVHEYDDLNRLVKTTYPDATFLQNEYSCCNLTSVRARDGLVTHYGFDAIKRPVSVLSPGRRVVTYHYDAVGNLIELQSGRGERVAWEYDDSNRMVARINQDGSRLEYAYDGTSGRLTWSKDAQGRETSRLYDSGGRLQSVSSTGLAEQLYTYNALGQPLTWSDDSQITSYTYDSLNRLSTIDGPLDNDTIAYTYDQWGRRSAWSYDGATESFTFDAFDRVATVTNPLGTFTPSYDGDTSRVLGVTYPVAGLETEYTYTSVNQNKRLSQIQHQGPGSVVIAQYENTFDGAGNILTWAQSQSGLGSGYEWEFQYEKDRQLASVVESPISGPPPSPQKIWRHQYDPSGNRSVSQQPGSTHSAVFNSRNQLTSLAGGGATWFRGQTNEAARVTVNGEEARVDTGGIFETILNLGSGSHDVTIAATDKAANVTTEVWRVNNGGASPRTFSYDLDGNLLDDGNRSYAWDGRNRLTSVTVGTDVWEFSYTGENLRASESKNGVPLRQWIWHGNSLVEERSSDGTKRRHWSYGVEELDSGGQQTGKRFLLADHLGSVRVVVDESGVVVASFAYDPWGRQTRVSGTAPESAGYTGHLEHESGLVMAPYRVYDPELGRWLSEDPIRETDDLNLYRYVSGGPIGSVDILGLAKLDYPGRPGYYYYTSTADLSIPKDKPAGPAGEQCVGLVKAMAGAPGDTKNSWIQGPTIESLLKKPAGDPEREILKPGVAIATFKIDGKLSPTGGKFDGHAALFGGGPDAENKCNIYDQYKLDKGYKNPGMRPIPYSGAIPKDHGNNWGEFSIILTK